jgi:hypothetical protein
MEVIKQILYMQRTLLRVEEIIWDSIALCDEPYLSHALQIEKIDMTVPTLYHYLLEQLRGKKHMRKKN